MENFLGLSKNIRPGALQCSSKRLLDRSTEGGRGVGRCDCTSNRPYLILTLRIREQDSVLQTPLLVSYSIDVSMSWTATEELLSTYSTHHLVSS